MAEVALALGVNKDGLILEEISKDTEEQAHLIQQIVGQEYFIRDCRKSYFLKLFSSQTLLTNEWFFLILF